MIFLEKQHEHKKAKSILNSPEDYFSILKNMNKLTQ